MDITPYSIGVVTYHARFSKYFKPLIEKLVRIFPEREIVCILNGHPDQTLQMRYLGEASQFLSQYRNVRYIAHTDHQSLSRCWNQLVILSSFQKTLILNDDTGVSELFKAELEDNLESHPFFVFNSSWSHFVISKEIIKKVGWFDERLLGVGYEDGDYAFRMAMNKIPVTSIHAHGLRNFVADNRKPGWEAISKTSSGNKYAEVNKEFFQKKWSVGEDGVTEEQFTHISDFNGANIPFSPVPGMETPLFYEFSILEKHELPKHQIVDGRRQRSTILLFQKMYFIIGRRTLQILRYLKTRLR